MVYSAWMNNIKWMKQNFHVCLFHLIFAFYRPFGTNNDHLREGLKFSCLFSGKFPRMEGEGGKPHPWKWLICPPPKSKTRVFRLLWNVWSNKDIKMTNYKISPFSSCETLQQTTFLLKNHFVLILNFVTESFHHNVPHY